MPKTYLANGAAGYVEGIQRLGIPPIYSFDAAYGVRDSGANGHLDLHRIKTVSPRINTGIGDTPRLQEVFDYRSNAEKEALATPAHPQTPRRRGAQSRAHS
jgi:hypothetical protein